MPKRSKPAHDKDDGHPKRTRVCTRTSSLSGFQYLPEELKTTILRFACGFDARPALNCMLVSRSFYQIVNPILYRHVKLSKTTALADFAKALDSQPSCAAYVNSLHLGPLTNLPDGLWPLRYEDPPEEDSDDYDSSSGDDDCYHEHERKGSATLVKTSWGPQDKALRPRWCNPGREWPHQQGWKPTFCRDAAIAAAMETARLAVDIWLDAESGHNFAAADGCGLGQNEWTVGVIYLQAIIDLYLSEMRRVEDARDRAAKPKTSTAKKPRSTTCKPSKECLAVRCGHYPRLLLEGFRGCNPECDSYKGLRNAMYGEYAGQHGWRDPGQLSKSRTTFLITRDQVKRHLARRGGPADHFEHPIFFTRRDLRTLQMVKGGAMVRKYHWVRAEDCSPKDQPWGRSLEQRLNHYAEDIYSSTGSPLPWPNTERATTPFETLSDGNFDLSHRDGLVALAKSILRQTNKLENLSLTGFMYECLQGDVSPVIKTLRCLSIGSPTFPSHHGRFLLPLSLPALEKLRYCSDYFDLSVAKHIDGQTGDWRNLREVQWDFGDSRLDQGHDVEHLAQIITALQGAQHGVPSSGSAAPSNSAATSAQEPANGQAPALLVGRYIEARHHPALISSLLDQASPEVCSAWLQGLPLDGSASRVRLVESRAAMAVYKEPTEPRQNYQLHREECERWWERCAWELESGGKLS